MDENIESTTTDPESSSERILTVPELSLIFLIGPSGSGKSTLAAQFFRPTEILSSDYYRAVVGDDATNQHVTSEAFDALHHIARLRLKLGRLTVIDATNLKSNDRAALISIAQDYNVRTVAIVLKFTERLCLDRNQLRNDRQVPPQIIKRHVQTFMYLIHRKSWIK
jgi:protein phosphatase